MSYTAAISACEQARQWQEAVALLDEMRACGGPMAPEAASFNVTMQAVALTLSLSLTLSLTLTLN